MSVLRDLVHRRGNEKKYFSHLTGFSSYEKFRRVLEFVLPGGHRKNITYWNTKASKVRKIDTSLLFDSDQESQSDDDGSSEPEADPGSSRDHVLSVEDEFLLVMMKLRLGLTNLDLAMRFNVAEATISNTFITWLNLLFIQLGTLKIWPHRNVILENMPKKFKEDYPNNIIIIDCTELKIQCPSSLVIQSQSYSNYKSTNTLEFLLVIAHCKQCKNIDFHTLLKRDCICCRLNWFSGYICFQPKLICFNLNIIYKQFIGLQNNSDYC